MNPKSPLDELFRRKLANFEMLPPDTLWENIKLERSKQQKTALKWWSPWAISAAVLLTSALLYQQFNKPLDAINRDIPNSKSNLSYLENQHQDHLPSKESINNIIIPISRKKNDKKRMNQTSVPQTSAMEEIFTPLQIMPDPVQETSEIKTEVKSSFSSFSALSGIHITLPHELSLYSEYLPVPFKKKLWFAKIDFLLSQDVIHNTLISKSATFEEYAALRNKHEDLNRSNSFMIRMGISTIKGWGLRSGIQYSRMRQTFSRQMPDASNTITRNTFETIDIPLILTKEQMVGKLRIGLSAGTYLNMTFNQKGSFYSPTGSLIEFTSSKPGSYPAFKNRLGASLYNGLTLSYPIGNSLEFMAEPYIRTRIPSISADDYVLDQKIWYGGIFIGIRKQIGKGFYLP
jgi:hypothetical protein